MEEIVLNMEHSPTYTGGKRKKHKYSSPSEAVYQKRKKWWIAHKFGEDAAAWAAKWRLGEPRKRKPYRPGEETSIDNAIRLVNRRVAEVKYRMETFNKTEEEAIKHLDDGLRWKDYEGKVQWGKIDPAKIDPRERPEDLYHKKIEPNIYKVLS